ncbi:negative regulation of cell cycle arrest [Sparganum proliferum]
MLTVGTDPATDAKLPPPPPPTPATALAQSLLPLVKRNTSVGSIKRAEVKITLRGRSESPPPPRFLLSRVSAETGTRPLSSFITTRTPRGEVTSTLIRCNSTGVCNFPSSTSLRRKHSLNDAAAALAATSGINQFDTTSRSALASSLAAPPAPSSFRQSAVNRRPSSLVIGQELVSRGWCDSCKLAAAAAAAAAAYDLDAAVTVNARSRLPPVHPGPAITGSAVAASAVPRITSSVHPRGGCESSVERISQSDLSGSSTAPTQNFSTTYLVNRPGRACVTRAESFKTFRLCSPPTGTQSERPRLHAALVRHSSFETALRLPVLSTEPESPRLRNSGESHSASAERLPLVSCKSPPRPLRSVASIGDISVCTKLGFETPPPASAAKPPPPPEFLSRLPSHSGTPGSKKGVGVVAAAAAAQRTNTPGMLSPNSLRTATNQSAQSQFEESRVEVGILLKPSHSDDMTGGGQLTTGQVESPPLAGAAKPVAKQQQQQRQSALPNYYAALRRPSAGGVSVKKYFRVNLPCTRASSRSNDHVMTDSLKLYEEQIFSHQILSGQRPMSWCIDVGCSQRQDDSAGGGDDHSSGSPSVTNSSSTTMSSVCSSSSSSNASHAAPGGPPRLSDLRRAARMRAGLAFFGRSYDQSGQLPAPTSCNISPITPRDNSPASPLRPIGLSPPPFPPGAGQQRGRNLLPQSRSRQLSSSSASLSPSPAVHPPVPPVAATNCDLSQSTTPEASTPNAENAQRELKLSVASAAGECNGGGGCGDASVLSAASSLASSLATVCPANPDTTPKSAEQGKPTSESQTRAPRRHCAPSSVSSNTAEETTEPSVSDLVGSPDPLSGANNNPRSPAYADATLSGHTDSVLHASVDVNGDGLDADELDNLRSVSMTSSMNSFSVVPPPHPWANSHSDRGDGSFIPPSLPPPTDWPVQGVPSTTTCPLCANPHSDCCCHVSSLSPESSSEEASLTAFNTASEGPTNEEGEEEEEEEEEDESTYAFSTLDSDFIAWMRLSVKDVTVEHPCYSSRQSESLASLTRQELLKVVNVFNSNLLGLQMTLTEDTNRLVATMRVFINLIKPVKMSLRQTLKHMPASEQRPATPEGHPADGLVPERLVSFFLPRGGSRVLQLAG